MEQTISKTGTTTPAKVKSLLFALANSISGPAIKGGWEKSSNELTCHFTVGNQLLSINIQNMEGAL